LPITGDHASIDGVGLRIATDPLGKVLHAERVDDRKGDVVSSQQ